MNASEKKRAREIAAALETAGASFESVLEELATLAADEQARYDALGDKAKAGDRGQQLDAAATALQVAADKAQEAFDTVNEAASELYGIDGVRPE